MSEDLVIKEFEPLHISADDFESSLSTIPTIAHRWPL